MLPHFVTHPRPHPHPHPHPPHPGTHTSRRSLTLTPLESPLFSSQVSPPLPRCFAYFCFLPCLVLPSPAPHLLLAPSRSPLELVGDFHSHDLLSSCSPRRLRDLARITWPCSMPLQPAFHSHCSDFTIGSILGLGGRSHPITLQPWSTRDNIQQILPEGWEVDRTDRPASSRDLEAWEKLGRLQQEGQPPQVRSPLARGEHVGLSTRG